MLKKKLATESRLCTADRCADDGQHSICVERILAGHTHPGRAGEISGRQSSTPPTPNPRAHNQYVQNCAWIRGAMKRGEILVVIRSPLP